VRLWRFDTGVLSEDLGTMEFAFKLVMFHIDLILGQLVMVAGLRATMYKNFEVSKTQKLFKEFNK